MDTNGYNKLKDVNLIDELNETFVDLEKQLLEDQEKWGDTWKERGLVYNNKSQEERWFEKMKKYYLDYLENGVPIPWLKVMGEAHIAYVREKNLKNIE